MKVISIINNKGGVGKTMTAQNLGAALAKKKLSVCLIDFDSQHNLTNRYENSGRGDERLRERNYRDCSIEDYLMNPKLEVKPIEVKDNLYLIPSTIRMSEMSARLYVMDPKENPSHKLKELCGCLSDVFDFVIVDCEPGMSAVMVNAAVAADLILIPVNCQDALEGASEGVYGILDSNRLNTDCMFLQTFYQEKLESSRNIRSRLIEDANENTFKTFIKRNEWLNKAGENGSDIFEFAPKTEGARAYSDLASEIQSHFKHKKVK